MVISIADNSKLKILNIKDPHLRGTGFKSPAGREHDDFNSDIDSKITQIENICKAEKIDLITISGDITDIKEPIRYTKNQIMPIYRTLLRLKNATNLKLIITIPGNHDLPNSSRQMKDKSVYDMLCELGVIQDVSQSGDNGLMIDCKGFRASFIGFDYTNRLSILNKELRAYNASIKPTKIKTFYTVLIHEHLLKVSDLNSKESKYLGNRFTYGYMIKHYPKVNCWIAGHYHKGYPSYKCSKTDTVIINNWNLTRLSRNYYVLNGSHVPNVAISTYTKYGITVKDIPLVVRDYVKAIVEVEKAEDSYNISEFVDKINNSMVTKTNSSDIKLNSRQKRLLEEVLEESKNDIQE